MAVASERLHHFGAEHRPFRSTKRSTASRDTFRIRVVCIFCGEPREGAATADFHGSRVVPASRQAWQGYSLNGKKEILSDARVRRQGRVARDTRRLVQGLDDTRGICYLPRSRATRCTPTGSETVASLLPLCLSLVCVLL